MGESWNRVKRYCITGWRNSSTRLFFWITSLLLVMLVLLGFKWGRKPFWILFSSVLPLLILYFPLLGFVHDLFERDWDDWYLW